jgi:asparagine synthase (glutamine-hydrolysing)
MKVDKMSMAASLEARCPFLDYQVVEFAFHLPVSMKLDHTVNKLLLRRVASNVLPKDIFARKKHGFDVPLKKWLADDLATMFWDVVTSQQFENQNIISQSGIKTIWNSMLNDVDGSARQIWSILILALWFDVSKHEDSSRP